jgi:hypothetical protein
MIPYFYIISIFILLGLCSIYVVAFRKEVFEIMKKENIECSKNVDEIEDFKKVYLVFKNSRNLNRYERQLLQQHLLLTASSLFLFLVFVVFIFLVKW